jgi:hypothetical protein
VRVLFATTAGAGHFGPPIPYAKVCGDAGHEVKVAASATFSGVVAGAGLDHAPFADVPQEIIGPIFARLPDLSFLEANETMMAEVFGRLDAQAALLGWLTSSTPGGRASLSGNHVPYLRVVGTPGCRVDAFGAASVLRQPVIRCRRSASPIGASRTRGWPSSRGLSGLRRCLEHRHGQECGAASWSRPQWRESPRQTVRRDLEKVHRISEPTQPVRAEGD